METVFVGTQRAARKPLHPLGRWRLDGEFAAARFQPLDHRLNVTANFSGNMITQPLRQHLGIGHRRFAEAETHTDFAAQPLGSAAREEGFAVEGRGCVKLFGERGYALYLDFGFVARGNGRDRGRRSAGWQSPTGSPGFWSSPVRVRLAPIPTDLPYCRRRPPYRYAPGGH